MKTLAAKLHLLFFNKCIRKMLHITAPPDAIIGMFIRWIIWPSLFRKPSFVPSWSMEDINKISCHVPHFLRQVKRFNSGETSSTKSTIHSPLFV